MTYQFLSSALNSEADQDILLRAHPPTVALRNLKAWYKPTSNTVNQPLHGGFQLYSMKPRQTPILDLTVLAYEDSMSCKDDSSVAFSGKDTEVLMCNTPGE